MVYDDYIRTSFAHRFGGRCFAVYSTVCDPDQRDDLDLYPQDFMCNADLALVYTLEDQQIYRIFQLYYEYNDQP